MKTAVLLLSAALATTGCTAVSTTALTAGPCHRDYTDARVCGNATSNEKVIALVEWGQSPADVRAIMGHDPERRIGGGTVESWGYVTDYNQKVMTWIAFTDHKVSSVTEQPWVRD
jgi:hypothetical protein